MKTPTKSQMKIIEFLAKKLNQREVVTLTELKRLFHATALRNLLENGQVIVQNKSRLREDDMEMVYWTEVSIEAREIPDNE